MSDNEHTAASLRHSEVLSVKNSPGDAIPELNQGTDDGSEVAAGTEEARNILSDNPGGAELSNEPIELPPHRATVSSQSCAVSCNAVVLTGETSDENIDGVWFIDRRSYLGDVSVSWHVGPMPLEHLRRVGVDLYLPRHLHPGPLGGNIEPADAGEQTTDPHAASRA
jgi:hypothetical protein